MATRTAALNRARDALAEAQRALAGAPPDTSPAERVALEVNVRQATEDVTVAQADLNASRASARATRAAGSNAVATARAEHRRAQRAVPRTRHQVVLAEQRLAVLRNPDDTSLQRLVTANAAEEARNAAAEVRRLSRQVGIQMPADEVLFFPTLPLRVDNVRAKRGDSVTGRVMTVSNSRLAVDSSLSLNDAKLVRQGAQVTIEEPDLGVKTTGAVTLVSDRPGTHQADPGRIYLEVTPKTAPAQLVGTSVKLTISIKSTSGEVLVVPLTALSVGADGAARVQVQRAGGGLEYVTVNPGLAAKGLVEVTPTDGGKLEPGDLVMVGSREGIAATSPPTSATGASGGSAGGAGSSTGGTTGGSGSSGATGPSTPSGGGASAGGSTSSHRTTAQTRAPAPPAPPARRHNRGPDGRRALFFPRHAPTGDGRAGRRSPAAGKRAAGRGAARAQPYLWKRSPGAGAAGRRPDGGRRRVDGDRRPVRVGQVHALEHPRLPGSPERRLLPDRRHRRRRA